MKKNKISTGRLKQTLDPIAKSIVSPDIDKITLLNELGLLATLNEAHLVSLHKSKILPLAVIKKLLKKITNLRKIKFSVLLDKPVDNGSYFLFENYLIEALGMDIAGSLHIGRSRNDINATTFKLNLRGFYKTICNSLCCLRSTMLKQASLYMNVVMPIYSQFQVAQVGTYAYYLLALEEAFSRDQHFLKDLFISLDECPIGAAAGCGTSFPVDRTLTSTLLGFSSTCNNALDAVANRDLALRILSTLVVLGTNLSRMAQDYQLWTTQEFSFFELPDNLCGGSSMMPQKKNPYLFEVIKGKSSSLNGLLIQALTAMHNVPFCNSVEVGTQAIQGIEIGLKNACDILTLSDLLVSKAIPIEVKFKMSITHGIAVAAGVTEFLVKDKNIPFRQAHHEIGARITQAITEKIDPATEVLKLTNNEIAAQDELFWAHVNEYGGGPGKLTSKTACLKAQQRLLKDSKWVTLIEKQWISAENKLKSDIKKIIN
jgi:argininosuccinate lyase